MAVTHETPPASRANAASGTKTAGAGGLATGPRDTVSGAVQETPTEPMERPGTENAEDARKTEDAHETEDAESAIDGPRLTPQGRTAEDASGEDETDPMGGVKTGQVDPAEG